MGKSTPAGSDELPAGGRPDDAVLDYLRNAPEELQPWAREKLAEFGDDAVGGSTSDDTAESVRASTEDIAAKAVEVGILEENDLALAELGEMDDEQRRAVRKARKRSRGHRVTSAPEKKSKVFTVLIVAALSLGLAFGVFMIGADDQKPIDANQLPDGHPDISAMEQAMPEAADHSERIFELEIALRQDPDDWESRLEMGVLLMNQRDYAEAEEQWLTVLEGEQGHPEAYYNLGFLYTQMDPPRFDDAISAWESLIELDPDSELAKDVQPFYETLLAGPPDGSEDPTSNDSP